MVFWIKNSSTVQNHTSPVRVWLEMYLKYNSKHFEWEKWEKQDPSGRRAEQIMGRIASIQPKTKILRKTSGGWINPLNNNDAISSENGSYTSNTDEYYQRTIGTSCVRRYQSLGGYDRIRSVSKFSVIRKISKITQELSTLWCVFWNYSFSKTCDMEIIILQIFGNIQLNRSNLTEIR